MVIAVEEAEVIITVPGSSYISSINQQAYSYFYSYSYSYSYKITCILFNVWSVHYIYHINRLTTTKVGSTYLG